MLKTLRRRVSEPKESIFNAESPKEFLEILPKARRPSKRNIVVVVNRAAVLRGRALLTRGCLGR